jgi:hypothetical protein
MDLQKNLSPPMNEFSLHELIWNKAISIKTRKKMDFAMTPLHHFPIKAPPRLKALFESEVS